MIGPALALAATILTAEPSAPPITALAFAPGDREVVVGSQSGLEVREWPGLTLKRTLKTRLEHIHDLAFAADGKRLAAGGGSPRDSGGAATFSWPEGELLREIESPHRDVVTAIAFGPGSASASVGADGSAIVYDDVFGGSSRPLKGHSQGATGVGFLNAETLISSSLDQSLRVWNLKSQTQVRSLTNHTQAIRALAVRPGSHPGPPMAATVGADRTLRFWQPTIGRLVRMIKLDSEPLALAWSRDGSRVAASCADGRARIVDPDTASLIQDSAGIAGWAYSIASGPNDGFLIGGENGRLAWIPREAPATVRKALRTQTDLIRQAEHCSVSSALLKTLGVKVGQQIRVQGDGGRPALFTIAEARDEDDRDVIRIGQSGRARFGTGTGADEGSPVVLSAMGPHPALSDAEARASGECVERWIAFDLNAQAIALAPHGGGIELETDRQAERFVERLRANGRTATAWICRGFRAPDDGDGPDRSSSKRWHITSTDLHEFGFPELGRLQGRRFPIAVSFHGMTGEGILIGGAAPVELKRAIQAELEKAVAGTGWPVRIAGPEDRLKGDDPRNIVNRYAVGGGVQIEQSAEARRLRGQAIADAAAQALSSPTR